MSGIFSSAAENCGMGWKSFISAALSRVTHQDWSLGFTSSARGALEQHITKLRLDVLIQHVVFLQGSHPNP